MGQQQMQNQQSQQQTQQQQIQQERWGRAPPPGSRQERNEIGEIGQNAQMAQMAENGQMGQNGEFGEYGEVPLEGMDANLLGNKVFERVSKSYPEDAGKITRMFLEMDRSSFFSVWKDEDMWRSHAGSGGDDK